MSYTAVMNFGLLADYDSMDDIEVIARDSSAPSPISERRVEARDASAEDPRPRRPENRRVRAATAYHSHMEMEEGPSATTSS